MNANQIINMVMRLFLRKVLSRGIDKGFDLFSKRGQGAGTVDPEAARMQDKQGRDSAKRAAQAMKVGRRIGRM